MDDYDGEGMFDDEEGNENEGFELASGGKERIIYLVDCHPHMFLPTKEDEENAKTFFDAAMECITADLKTRIINSANDETGLCFFNTREKKNVHGWEGIYIFQECDLPSAQRIEEASKINKDFEPKIGTRKQAQAATINPVYHALFTAQSMMQSSTKLGTKRVLIFTNNDDPLAEVTTAEQRSMRNQTIAKARDMIDSNISIELLPMSRPGEEFDVRLLYRDILPEGDEDDPSSFLVSASTKFDEMLNQMRKKTLKKRVQRKMSLVIAPGIEIGVDLYAMVRATRPSRAGTLDSRSQQPLKVETKYICSDTGGDLTGPLPKYYPYGGNKVIFQPEEVQEMRKLREPGMQLLGFKPLSCLKAYHNLSPPGFLYPSDEVVNGSIKAFIALHTAMVKFQRFALCSYAPSPRSNVKLVALLAQEEVLDEFGQQVEPAGFQLISLPFSDDIRDPVKHHASEEGPAPRASQEQIDRAIDLMKKIDLGKTFTVVDIPNPALQKHYASLQALALDEDTIPEVEDCTLPDEEGITRPAVNKAVNAFKESIYGPDYEQAEAEAAAQQNKPSEAARKRKADADAAKSQQADYDWKKLAESGKLNTLKNEELKIYLRANALQLGGSKNVMIERILKHMGY